VHVLTQRLEGIIRLVNGKAMAYENCSRLTGVGQEMLVNQLRQISRFGCYEHR